MDDFLSIRVMKGSLWLGLGQAGQRLIGLVSTVVLARLLFPDDYGLIALGATVIAFFQVISDFQFGTALIKYQDATRGEYNTAWTCNILRGGLVALLMVICAPVLADWMDEGRLELLLYVLALSPLIDGWKNIGIIDFQKNLKYQRVVLIEIAAKLASLTVALSVAVIYRNYWALVAGTLVATFITLIMSYVLSPYRPTFSLSHWRRLFGFSIWLMLSQIMIYFNQRLEYLVMGVFLPTAVIGLYNLSYELAILVGSQTIMPLIAPLFPGFAKIANDPARLKAAYQKSVEIVSLVGIPAGLGFTAIAPEFVPIVLGPNWVGAVLPIQIFCIAGALSMPAIGSVGLLPAVGETKAIFKINLLLFLVRSIAVPVTISLFGFFGAVVGRGIFGILWLFQLLWIIERRVHITMADTFGRVWRYYACAAIMATVVLAASPVLQAWILGHAAGPGSPFAANPMQSTLALALLMGIKIALGVLVYGFALWLSWKFAGRPDSGDKYVATLVKNVLTRIIARQNL